MVDIQMEIKDVEIKKVGSDYHINLTGKNGQKVCIITDKFGTEQLQEATEKAVVASEYWYCNMQEENDRLQQRIMDLEETLDNIGYEESV